MGQIDDGAFARIEGDGNSVAVIVSHLAGNLRSRWTDFLTTDGEKPDRNRDQEFEQPTETRERLMARWADGWQVLDGTLAALRPDDLTRYVTIRGEPHLVTQAIQRQLVHYAYHIGQIVLRCRDEAGEAWRTLSVPRGESDAFNRKPSRYLR